MTLDTLSAREGIVLCPEVMEQCVCSLPADHEGFHHCGLDVCGGEWLRDAEGFHVGRLPGGLSLAAIFGFEP